MTETERVPGADYFEDVIEAEGHPLRVDDAARVPRHFQVEVTCPACDEPVHVSVTSPHGIVGIGDEPGGIFGGPALLPATPLARRAGGRRARVRYVLDVPCPSCGAPVVICIADEKPSDAVTVPPPAYVPDPHPDPMPTPRSTADTPPVDVPIEMLGTAVAHVCKWLVQAAVDLENKGHVAVSMATALDGVTLKRLYYIIGRSLEPAVQEKFPELTALNAYRLYAMDVRQIWYGMLRQRGFTDAELESALSEHQLARVEPTAKE